MGVINMSGISNRNENIKECYYKVATALEDKKSKEEIFAKYGQSIVMYEEMPAVLANVMGDHAYMARFTTDEEVQEFLHYVIEKKEG